MNGQFLKERIKSIVVALLMLPAGAFLVYGGLGFDIPWVEGDGERSWFLVIVGVGMLLYGAFAVWNSYWGVNEDVERNKRYSKEAEEKIKATRAAIDSFHGNNQVQSNKSNNKETTNTNSNKEKAIPTESLQNLKQLYDEGILTEEEFVEKKRELLGL